MGQKPVSSLEDHTRPRNLHFPRIFVCKLISSSSFFFVQKVIVEPQGFIDKRIHWNAQGQMPFSITFAWLDRAEPTLSQAIALDLDSMPLITSSIYLSNCSLMLTLSLMIIFRCALWKEEKHAASYTSFLLTAHGGTQPNVKNWVKERECTPDLPM